MVKCICSFANDLIYYIQLLFSASGQTHLPPTLKFLHCSCAPTTALFMIASPGLNGPKYTCRLQHDCDDPIIATKPGIHRLSFLRANTFELAQRQLSVQFSVPTPTVVSQYQIVEGVHTWQIPSTAGYWLPGVMRIFLHSVDTTK